MTAIMGEQADLYGLDRGIDGHGDTQEGIAKMAEQALVGKYKEAGIGHSITTGLSYFDGMSSEQVFEVKWRLSLLTDITDGEEVTDDLIKRHRARAAKAYYRIFRGTDELPWFKDASYYLEGTKQVWQYMEKHRGDELRLTLLLMGKRNISEEHTRIMLETATP